MFSVLRLWVQGKRRLRSRKKIRRGHVHEKREKIKMYFGTGPFADHIRRGEEIRRPRGRTAKVVVAF